MDLTDTKYVDSWWAARCADGAELLVCAFKNRAHVWAAWVRLHEPDEIPEAQAQSYVLSPPGQGDIASSLAVLDAAVKDGTLTLHHGPPTRVVRMKLGSTDIQKIMGALRGLADLGFSVPLQLV